MNRYFITCSNNLYCCMDTNYVVIAENEEEFINLVDMWAFDNYVDLGGSTDAEWDDDGYTQEELDAAPYVIIEEYNEESHGEWDWFELIYDGSNK